ncbi:MAG TPA: copper resistance protein B [Gammaproteobacteria bacterium]|nr:copper resistance protein B [Gammaproteobacteria bacterium]
MARIAAASIASMAACGGPAAAQHTHAHDAPAQDAPAQRPYLPPPTPEERAAAFPDLGHEALHEMHEDPFTTFVLFDRLEAQRADGGDVVDWDVDAWAGRSLTKLRMRTEGQRRAGRTEDADLELLFSRSFARWWDYVAGARQDFRPEPDTTWAAFGVEGLAPYRFEIRATGYVGEGGKTAARVQTEYELLMTNRLVLQPRVELNWYGEADPGRGIGSGLSDTDIGLRLRYEIRREIAPYLGVTRESKHGRTADLAKAAGEDPNDTRFVVGIRLWF